MIPFNKPYLTGKETYYIEDAVKTGKISGNGKYTQLCQNFFEERYQFKKCLLTTSCTDALEMASILLDIKAGDEVIMPSYTFVSTSNAFVLRGAKIVFADSCKNQPNIDHSNLESIITSKTKAIVVVHYAGVACDMDVIMEIAKKNDLFVVEDAAQAIDSFYKGIPLGKIGHLATFSFHETKNIISGEGGMLVINDEQFIDRAEIIWEKGTNRSAFFRGEVDKYSWVDVGSSYLPSDIIAAFLWAQLENLDDIQKRRKEIWDFYHTKLSSLLEKEKFKLPLIPEYATNNAHMFYLILPNISERNQFISQLKTNKIHSVFHYLSLHDSPYYKSKHNGRLMKNCNNFSNCLVRLPLFYELKSSEKEFIVEQIINFFTKEKFL